MEEVDKQKQTKPKTDTETKNQNKKETESLDGFAKDKFVLNLKNNPDVETFATLTELPLWMLTRYAPLVSIAVSLCIMIY